MFAKISLFTLNFYTKCKQIIFWTFSKWKCAIMSAHSRQVDMEPAIKLILVVIRSMTHENSISIFYRRARVNESMWPRKSSEKEGENCLKIFHTHSKAIYVKYSWLMCFYEGGEGRTWEQKRALNLWYPLRARSTRL
jgi:hypothetical protein